MGKKIASALPPDFPQELRGTIIELFFLTLYNRGASIKEVSKSLDIPVGRMYKWRTSGKGNITHTDSLKIEAWVRADNWKTFQYSALPTTNEEINPGSEVALLKGNRASVSPPDLKSDFGAVLNLLESHNQVSLQAMESAMNKLLDQQCTLYEHLVDTKLSYFVSKIKEVMEEQLSLSLKGLSLGQSLIQAQLKTVLQEMAAIGALAQLEAARTKPLTNREKKDLEKLTAGEMSRISKLTAANLQVIQNEAKGMIADMQQHRKG
jgi:hypothetical protein